MPRWFRCRIHVDIKKALQVFDDGVGARMARTKNEHMRFQLRLMRYRYVPFRLAKDLNWQIALPIAPNMIPTISAIDGVVKANKLVRAGRIFDIVLVIRWRVSRL